MDELENEVNELQNTVKMLENKKNLALVEKRLPRQEN
jgi:hypothetical protein